MSSTGARGGADADTAPFGRKQAFFGAVIGVLIALTLILIGYYAMRRDPHTAEATMMITSVTECNPPGTQHTSRFECTITVDFTVSGQHFIVPGVKVVLPSIPLAGSPIMLRYNPADPSDVVQEESPRRVGWTWIGAGVVVGVVTVGAAFWAQRSEKYARIGG